ncbi:MAG: tryptophan--tRNA ligase, partial [Candidatus Eremiobacteraeota bacterium]|nr:tryptophan--tRNA ligase [Candidatus Eremiobacteraeota bacterium]
MRNRRRKAGGGGGPVGPRVRARANRQTLAFARGRDVVYHSSVSLTSSATRPRVLSGMRPTGPLHLGHLVGVLTQWAGYSETADAFFEIADLHAYTTEFEDAAKVREARNAMVAAWLAAGVDPQRSTIFLQSAVPEIAELHTLLSMITPVSWLERVPTYKGQIEALGQRIATYGFLGYPLLQLCDIAIVRGQYVPVGRDQLAHLELAREIVRRFNYLYGAGREILIEPHPTLSEFAEVPGIDGRKMSKSYDNAI